MPNGPILALHANSRHMGKSGKMTKGTESSIQA